MKTYELTSAIELAINSKDSKTFHNLMLDLAYINEDLYDKYYEQWILTNGNNN